MPFGSSGSSGGGGSVLGMGIVLSLRDSFSQTSDNIKRKYKGLGDSFEVVSAQITRSLNRMKMGFAAMVVGALMLAPLGKAVSVSMDFNAVMSDVGAKSNATGKQFEMLKEQAMALGDATKFTALQAGEGQAFLAMAGFNTNQIIAAMPGLLSLAAAGNLDLGRSADIASNILSQFQLQASESGRVADVMAKTIVKSNTNMEQMSEAMKYFGPTAAAFRISLEESSAMIGLLGNNGLQGSLATRALGTSLARLTRPTKIMAKEMEKLGFEAFDNNGKFIGMIGLIKEMERTTKGLTDKEKQRAISTIFGGEAIQEVNALMGATVTVMKDGREATIKGSEAMAHFTGELKNAAGAADELARKQLDNLKGDFTILRSVIETTMIRIGDAIEPVLRPVVQLLSGMVSVFGKFMSTGVGKVLIGIVGITGVLLVIVGALVIALNMASFASAQAALAFTGMGMTEVGLAFATGGLTAGFGALAVAIWAAVAPLLPFVAIGVAVIAIGVAMYKMINSNNEKLVKFGTILGVVLGPIFGLLAAFLALKRGIKEFRELMAGGEMKSGFIGTLTRIGGVVLGVMEIFKSWNGQTFTMSEKMRTALEKAGILQFVLNLGTWVIRIKELMKGIVSQFKTMFSPITDAWVRLKQAFAPVTAALGKFDLFVGKATSGTHKWLMVGKMIGFMITLPIRLVATALSLVIDAVTLTVNAFNWMLGAVVSGWGWVVDKVLAVVNFFMELPTMFVNVGKAIVQGLWTGIKSIWSWLVSSLIELIGVLPFGNELLEYLGVGGGQMQVANSQVPSLGAVSQNIADTNAAASTSRNTVSTNSSKEVVKEIVVKVDLDKREIGQAVTDFQNAEEANS